MLPSWVWLALGVGLFALSGWLTRSAYRTWCRLRRRRRVVDALQAESSAATLLIRCGYRVLERQVRSTWPVRYGERLLELELRADYLVEQCGQRWVAEVKSGPLVCDLRHGPTRRQLLEYLFAFGADGVLLVDTQSRSVQRVEFPNLTRDAEPRRAGYLWYGVLLGAAVASALFASGLHFWHQRHGRCDQLEGKVWSDPINSSSAPSRNTRRSCRPSATASNCFALDASLKLSRHATST